ncbi:MAG: PepSY domain-containing protein [Phenylobacterium sp.]|uniref:PepSY domain-containing protein n=1 Tax=Phenylobacterium sp. TaxID=1871053 RepID=UPI001A58D21A|nr:PepSY domain-containing protein [Phenylobacterium sp.]MBL8774199.1 PepSY domain-containing protein [Phenylobacterium sp.]
MLRVSTQIHKWLGLVVGLQVLAWVAGGLVMTAIPIERVRGEHHLARFQADALPAEGLVSYAAAAARLGVTPVEATLKSTLRGPLWVLKDADGRTHVADAATGNHVTALPQAEARFLAGAQYQGQGKPVAVRWFAEPPQEAGRRGPLWAVDFDDAEKTRFYVSPETGEVVSRRSDVWRFYDFFWRLHILDFRTGEDFNHPLIIAAAALSLPMAVTGLIILVIRLARDLKGLRRRRAAG